MTYQQTKQWIVDNYVDNHVGVPQLLEAAEYIKKDEVIAFPTETVYGLGGNAESDEAINRIFEAKGRPSDNPLIVHISAVEQLEQYVEDVPDKAKQLIDAFWPGALTIVFQHNGKLSTRVTAGLPTVAVRMPDHPIALAFIEATNRPIAAPSANRSGRPSPTTAQHVINDLDGKIAGVIDGGPTGVGVESTVIDVTTDHVMILRPGGVTKEAIEKVVGSVHFDPALTKVNEAPRSPGMKYTHYAPNAPLVLVDGDIQFFQEKVLNAHATGKNVGALVTNEHKQQSLADKEVIIGSREDLDSVAHNLYDALRSFEDEEVDVIFAEVLPETELGTAIMNRLSKAAGGTILRKNKGNG